MKHIAVLSLRQKHMPIQGSTAAGCDACMLELLDLYTRAGGTDIWPGLRKSKGGGCRQGVSSWGAGEMLVGDRSPWGLGG